MKLLFAKCFYHHWICILKNAKYNNYNKHYVILVELLSADSATQNKEGLA